MKAKRSWRKRVNSLLGAIMVLVLLFLMWTNGYYNSQTRENLKSENATTVELWESFVKIRLDTLYEHIFELLLTVYNNAELAPGSPQMEYMTRKKCLDLMTNKLHINSDPDCFFLIDTHSELKLFSANSGLTPALKTSLKNSYQDVALRNASKLYNKLWNIEVIDGDAYFVKSIALGKYVAGTMSRFNRYDISQNFISGEKSASFLLIGEESEVLYHGGDPSVSYKSNSATSVTMGLSFAQNGNSVILATRGGNSLTITISIIILFVSLACAALLIILVLNLKRMVVLPTKELLKANQEIISGNTHYRITADAGSEEFDVLFSSFNKMTTQIVNLRIESYDRLLREQENTLLILRAQIKPHFFLNAITTVSNMTYQNRLEDIRSYLQYLSKFIRYMLNSQRKWVTINEELSHISNYLDMQTLRFPGSINSHIECDESIGDTQIPILMIFTLIENTFKHAMSLYETLELTIKCKRHETDTFSGCCLIVEDNGEGFTEDFLTNIESKTDFNSLPKDHFGLSNIRYTLQLTYNRSDLLFLSNRDGGGARVEVYIPDLEVTNN